MYRLIVPALILTLGAHVLVRAHHAPAPARWEKALTLLVFGLTSGTLVVFLVDGLKVVQ